MVEQRKEEYREKGTDYYRPWVFLITDEISRAALDAFYRALMSGTLLLPVPPEHGDEAKVLAGGQSLIPILNMRLASPAHLVDINRVAGLVVGFVLASPLGLLLVLSGAAYAGYSLFGRDVVTPLFGVRVPVKPHPLADPEKGSGIAMISKSAGPCPAWRSRA